MTGEPPDVEGIEHRYVDAGGLRIHVAEAGEGEPVLLLHGWPQNWLMWRRVIKGLAPRYRLLAPDLRGFGWTEAPGDGYDAETFARDQIALLDALGIDRVKLIGHDWGGWTSMLLGLNHADRVERMIVCDAPHPWPRVTPSFALEAWRSWYAVALSLPGLGARLTENGWITRNILSRGNAGTPFGAEEIDAYVDSLRTPERARAVHHLYRYYQRTFRDGLRGRWRSQRLTVPTLLLWGDRDRYLSTRLTEGYEPYADRMTTEIVAHSGHFIVDERPELILDRALTFFNSPS
jgi:pimeloyl-ACP methyl ester carboxylesterase